MNLTPEQEAIIETSEDMVINAVAGSGKTSTIVEYARNRPHEKMLYLAFNKSVKEEAVHKFREREITNVKVDTAHSLALRLNPKRAAFSIKKGSYTAFELRSVLGLNSGDLIRDMKMARHVLQTVSCFCNSSFEKVADMDYTRFLHEDAERKFVEEFLDAIVYHSRVFLGKMRDGKAEVTHDYYLKEFQLAYPRLSFDAILFDEGQDASGSMLDVFLGQKARKVIVGDQHQQIYGWRFAVNSLQKVDFTQKNLTTSFRFGQDIADMAMAILETKNHLIETKVPSIRGAGGHEQLQSRAILGRSNANVLVAAIRQLIEEKNISSLYFEGNFNTYTYADEGGSVYDVLNLYLGKGKIRDPLVRSMRDFSQLEEYAEETGDAPLKGIIEIVEKYGRELPSLIKEIKAHHVDSNKKHEADIIFSTVHKAKGMEYDEVDLVDDLLGEEKLKELINANGIDLHTDRLLEEINILYVAATRTRNKLNIPEKLLPLRLRENGEAGAKPDEPKAVRVAADLKSSGHDVAADTKSYSYESARQKHPDAYRKWTDEEDEQITVMFCEGSSIRDMAAYFGRSGGAIRSRIKKLELEEKYGYGA